MQDNHRNGYLIKKEDNNKSKKSNIGLIILFCLILFVLLFAYRQYVKEASNIKSINISVNAEIKMKSSEPEKAEFVKEEEKDEKQKYDGKKVIAITFDDGPGKYTKELVDFLVKNNVYSTFFMIGQNVAIYPNNVKYAYDHGMEIGNHTYDHKNLKKLDKSGILNQIDSVDDLFLKIIGTKSKLYRPPGGNKNELVLSTISKPCIIWNVDTIDWKTRDKQKIIDIAMKDIDDGDIVLFHEIYRPTIDAIKEIIPKLKEQGYEMVTVSKLYEIKGINLEDGKIYYGM